MTSNPVHSLYNYLLTDIYMYVQHALGVIASSQQQQDTRIQPGLTAGPENSLPVPNTKSARSINRNTKLHPPPGAA